ncbi:Nif3-like dinuclear metal center hexameric protein [Cohnella panacarvi]|uniref:Nif3-like dinuclear metal center hexameric protein n=1 Tax=Cohnella panacarvi TaxID=400776 RepID=UPI00047E72B5|nr:Nif3-like dinuclear metal center hexameric protein [Cohnella panacarvi]
MKITIGDIIAVMTMPDRDPRSSDILIAGEPDSTVRAIAVSFSASIEAIEKAIEAGANLLVTHEGIYYNHHHDPRRYEDDPVVQAKRELIARAGMSVYRNHDHWHRLEPDGIMLGLVRSMGWEASVVRHDSTASFLALPGDVTVDEIARLMKRRLGLSSVRVVGDVSRLCNRVGIAVGYRGGGDHAIPLFEREKLDLLIVGEGPEWETPEYVKDAARLGRSRALIVLGHRESEVPGMRLLAEWLSAKFPGVPIHYIEEEPLFRYI